MVYQCSLSWRLITSDGAGISVNEGKDQSKIFNKWFSCSTILQVYILTNRLKTDQFIYIEKKREIARGKLHRIRDKWQGEMVLFRIALWWLRLGHGKTHTTTENFRPKSIKSLFQMMSWWSCGVIGKLLLICRRWGFPNPTDGSFVKKS